jgi:hypothetical protein
MSGQVNQRFHQQTQNREKKTHESLYFIELITELSETPDIQWKETYREGDKLLAIIVKSIITSRKNQIKS